MLKSLIRGDDLLGVTISGVVAATAGQGDALVPRSLEPAGLRSLDLADLRAHRRALAGEAARVQRWRRVVQARIDLTVAVAVPVGRIGVDDHVALQLGQLAADLDRGGSGCGTTALPGLRDAARALSRYDEQVRTRLAKATAELVDRYARVPGDALSAGPLAG